ncbi:MAG: dienelactone hydrolase family protein [Caldilineaceae bacterium]|nr:dienelactone hydrolase family protein [Caldilineaceae bacterium]
MPAPQLHERMPIRRAGAALERAHAAMIMLHGRGASAEDILGLAYALNAPDVAFLAPQAAQSAWYPNRFIAPVASNEPWLSSALAVVNGLLETVLAAGIKAEQTLILGFSQGGCLALEYAARHARRYGGVVGLSAGLIENGDQPRAYDGTLSGTPVLLGCSDVDQHISLARVDRTAQVLADLGAVVDKRIYPGMGHTVNQDEVDGVQAILNGLQ